MESSEGTTASIEMTSDPGLRLKHQAGSDPAKLRTRPSSTARGRRSSQMADHEARLILEANIRRNQGVRHRIRIRTVACERSRRALLC